MRIEEDSSNVEHILKTFEELNQYALEIGVFGEDDSFMAMLANVHEFGMTITPKRKWLTIPTAEAGDRSAREIEGLFKPRGANLLAVKHPTRKGEFIVMFWLVESVTIPERSFVRSTFDEKEGDWANFFSKRLGNILDGTMTAQQLYEQLGMRIQRDIQNKMRALKSPPKAPATLARAPRKTNPLINSGRLLGSVTWKVVRNT